MAAGLCRQGICKKRKMKRKNNKIGVRRSRASRKFILALSIVSIIGFLSIMTASLFNFSIDDYVESLWLLVLGIALILETSIKEIEKVKRAGVSSNMLGKITMIVVGGIAVVAAILSLPQINIQHATFLAVKGIISILAIIFIIIQTWISKKE
jgi:hypothetical protein